MKTPMSTLRTIKRRATLKPADQLRSQLRATRDALAETERQLHLSRQLAAGLVHAAGGSVTLSEDNLRVTGEMRVTRMGELLRVSIVEGKP